MYDATGNTLIRKMENDYEYRANVGNTDALGNNRSRPVDYRPVRTTTTLADVSPSLVSKQEFSYDPNVSYNSQTDVYEYDFGSGAAGDFKRRNHTDFVTDPNYTGTSGAYLRNLPLQSWVSSDAAGSSKASLSQMEYDNYANDASHASLTDRANVFGFDSANYGTGNTKRGNVTAMTSYTDAAGQTGAITAYSQYDVLGNIVKMIDAKGSVSTISYEDNFGAPDGEARTNSAPPQLNGQSTFAMATSATNPTNFTTHAQFDYFTDVAVDAEDANGIVSSSIYNDPLERPTQSIISSNVSALKQQKTTVYDDANRKVTVTSDLNALNDNSIKSEGFYDGLGRTTETRTYEAGGGYIATLTEYDALGRVKRITNPFRPGQNDPQLWTTSQYDALGRVINITTPDGAVSQNIYSGNTVTNTDQAGKQHRSITNALGQVIRIDEPDDTGNLGPVSNPNQSTTYLYDALNDVVKVMQGIQSRYFKYDSLKRLLRVRQPEQGTNSNLMIIDGITGNSDWSAGFIYDANGNIVTATDAKGTVINNSYDNLNRVLSRTYSDNTPAVSYMYDDPGVQYSKGKTTKVSNSISTSQVLAIDNLGRILSSRQITDGVNYDSSYTYNLAGEVLEETYPSGRKVKNSFASDGNFSKVETKTASGNYQSMANNFGYTAHGIISQMQIGNGKWETTQFNSRLQATQIGLGNSASDTSVWKLNYDFGVADNNGNIKTQIITSPAGTFNQSFTYDSVDRLKTAQETLNGVAVWTQSFNYDRYGNRTGFNQNVNGQASNSTPQIDSNTNRFAAGQGFTYDLAGNVIADPQGRQFIFNGDNRQTQVKDSSNNIIGSYSYDGDGKRIKKTTPQETTIFVYSGEKLVAEYTNSTSVPQSPTTQYITTDRLESPRLITDDSGNIISLRDFMPFGESLQRTNSGTDTIRQKFTGYQHDEETNLDFAEARYYNSQNGRFTAVDPLTSSGKSDNPQTFNRYVYAGNNPVVTSDPSGLEWVYDQKAPKGIDRPVWISHQQFEGGGYKEWKDLTYTTRSGDTVTLDPAGPVSVAGVGDYWGWSKNGTVQGTGAYAGYSTLKNINSVEGGVVSALQESVVFPKFVPEAGATWTGKNGQTFSVLEHPRFFGNKATGSRYAAVAAEEARRGEYLEDLAAASSRYKGIKLLGKLSFVVTTGFAVLDGVSTYKRGDKFGVAKASADGIMGGVGFFGGTPGAAAATIYNGIDLITQIPDPKNEAHKAARKFLMNRLGPEH